MFARSPPPPLPASPRPEDANDDDGDNGGGDDFGGDDDDNGNDDDFGEDDHDLLSPPFQLPLHLKITMATTRADSTYVMVWRYIPKCCYL